MEEKKKSHGYISKVVTVHNVGTCEEVELTAPVILSLGIAYGRSAACLRCFTLRERGPLYPLSVRQGVSQNSSWCFKIAEYLLPMLGVERRSLSHSACSLVTVLTELS